MIPDHLIQYERTSLTPAFSVSFFLLLLILHTDYGLRFWVVSRWSRFPAAASLSGQGKLI